MAADQSATDRPVEEPVGPGLSDEIDRLVRREDNTTSEKLLVSGSVGQSVHPSDSRCPVVGQDRVGVRSTPPVHRGRPPDASSESDQLRQLSELLGVHVEDVELWESPTDGRRRWYLVMTQDRRQWAVPVHSREVRSPTALNALTRRWGRTRALPELTKADGRRALRLMHEITEAEAALGLDTDTTHLKENDR
ncbi:hypothetical protein SAMN05661080_02483 [Modestobacter sp. DSM 44400]|uniref:hypothetical protein n=1 Tax=Modestobacter sp. DSM 44400 TaxID=1550230 RepID=UPI000894B494|nr:hypothetical protein [Modestobacter sp. DSM 44400]SDY15297.1 hypothetical protein SAMN05661080_02483 [Modestobacter sp. DSM 44400]